MTKEFLVLQLLKAFAMLWLRPLCVHSIFKCWRGNRSLSVSSLPFSCMSVTVSFLRFLILSSSQCLQVYTPNFFSNYSELNLPNNGDKVYLLSTDKFLYVLFYEPAIEKRPLSCGIDTSRSSRGNWDAMSWMQVLSTGCKTAFFFSFISLGRVLSRKSMCRCFSASAGFSPI